MFIRSLSWDSAFFGCAVSRLDIDNECSADTLRKELFEREGSDYDVCYVYVYHDDVAISSFLRSAGARRYDRKVTFRKDSVLPEENSSDRIVTDLKDLTPEAIDIAVSSGIHSRFYLDPYFRSKQPLLYKQWITNCFEHENGRVFGIVQNDELAAIAGVSISECVGHLELIAVNPKYRRRGFAKKLILTAEDYYWNSGASSAEVVTQLDNTSACATYQSCGYNMISVVDVWHLWKKDIFDNPEK